MGTLANALHAFINLRGVNYNIGLQIFVNIFCSVCAVACNTKDTLLNVNQDRLMTSCMTGGWYYLNPGQDGFFSVQEVPLKVIDSVSPEQFLGVKTFSDSIGL